MGLPPKWVKVASFNKLYARQTLIGTVSQLDTKGWSPNASGSILLEQLSRVPKQPTALLEWRSEERFPFAIVSRHQWHAACSAMATHQGHTQRARCGVSWLGVDLLPSFRSKCPIPPWKRTAMVHDENRFPTPRPTIHKAHLFKASCPCTRGSCLHVVYAWLWRDHWLWFKSTNAIGEGEALISSSSPSWRFATFVLSLILHHTTRVCQSYQPQNPFSPTIFNLSFGLSWMQKSHCCDMIFIGWFWGKRLTTNAIFPWLHSSTSCIDCCIQGGGTINKHNSSPFIFWHVRLPQLGHALPHEALYIWHSFSDEQLPQHSIIMCGKNISHCVLIWTSKEAVNLPPPHTLSHTHTHKHTHRLTHTMFSLGPLVWKFTKIESNNRP